MLNVFQLLYFSQVTGKYTTSLSNITQQSCICLDCRTKGPERPEETHRHRKNNIIVNRFKPMALCSFSRQMSLKPTFQLKNKYEGEKIFFKKKQRWNIFSITIISFIEYYLYLEGTRRKSLVLRKQSFFLFVFFKSLISHSLCYVTARIGFKLCWASRCPWDMSGNVIAQVWKYPAGHIMEGSDWVTDKAVISKSVREEDSCTSF